MSKVITCRENNNEGNASQKMCHGEKVCARLSNVYLICRNTGEVLGLSSRRKVVRSVKPQT
jgi:hypothetical protein